MTTTRSAKNKAVKVQNLFRDSFIEAIPELQGEIECAVMGERGLDIKLSTKARELFPYSVEVKAKKVGYTAVYDALEQAESQDDTLIPIAAIKQDRKKPIICMNLDDFLEMIKNDT